MVTDVNHKLYEKMKRCREVEKSAWKKFSNAEDRVNLIYKEVDQAADELVGYNALGHCCYTQGLISAFIKICHSCDHALPKGNKVMIRQTFTLYTIKNADQELRWRASDSKSEKVSFPASFLLQMIILFNDKNYKSEVPYTNNFDSS